MGKIKLVLLILLITIILIGGFFLLVKTGRLKVSMISILPTFLNSIISPAKSFNPEDNRSIGYEFLDDGKVVHIWNTQDDYFFNKSSGIQFTNHYQEYWTRNIFCIGYYSGGEWNKIKCADELENFNKEIYTDNENYVNTTLWKDIEYNSYDMRLGINYYLGLDDENLTITIYGKNIGIDIPFDLGFAWRTTNINIGKGINYILINDIQYQLRNETEIIDICWNETVINCTFYNEAKECLEYGIPPEYNITYCNYTTFLTDIDLSFPNLDYATYKLMAKGDEYIELSWNKNLPNKVIVKSNYETQYNSPVTLLINAGIFSAGQEKSTKMYWSDPATAPNISYVIPTPTNDTTTTNTSIEINVSITDSGLDEVIWNWNSTNYTMYDDSLVFMMNFDNVSALGENDSQISDLSGYGNNITGIAGNPVWNSSGKYGGAFEFDGADDTMESTNDNAFPDGAGSRTISLWFKVATGYTCNDDGLFAYGTLNQYQVYGVACADGSNLRFYAWDYDYDINVGIIGTTWHHYASVYNGSDVFTYYDGKNVDTTARPNLNTVLANYYEIGDVLGDYGKYFKGKIDEVRIWNKSLSESKIQILYMSNLNKYDIDKWALYVNQSQNSTDGLVDATYTYLAYASDISGNTNQTKERTITIGVDTINPDLTINSPVPYQNFSSGVIVFNFSINEGWGGGAVYSLDNFSTNISMTNTSLRNFNYSTTTPLSDGTYYVSFSVNDTAGNINMTEGLNFTIDTINPNINITFPLNNTNWSNVNLDVNFTRSDVNLFNCWYSNDTDDINKTLTTSCNNLTNVVWSEGQHNITIWANDSVSNENSSRISFTIDTTPPITYVNASPQFLEAGIDTTEVNWTIGYDLVGINFMHFNITNPDGTEGFSSDCVETYIGACSLSVEITFGTFTDVGYYNVSLWVNDTVGNWIHNMTWFYVNDSISPGVTINSPLNQWYTDATILFNVTATDTSGVDTCEYTLNDGAINYSMSNMGDEWNGSTTLVEGEHEVYFYCNDTFGNTNYTENETFYIDTYDPAIAIVYPFSNNTNWSNIYLDINFTRSDANLAYCWYSNDTYDVNSTPDATCNNITDVVWSEGNHNITIWVNDSAGSMDSSGISFTIDSISPSINITSPINNTNWSNVNLEINFTRSDLNLFNCWYSNDTYDINSTPDATCNNVTVIVWSEGQHNVTIWTNDTFGNINSSRISFTIDTINPGLNITAPINNTDLSFANIDVNYTISNTNIESCWYSNDTYLKNTSLTCGANITTVSWNSGQHNVTIWINDSAGNINRSSINFTISVDTTYPTFDNLRNHTQQANRSSFNYDLDVSDNAGVDSFILNDTSMFNITLKTGIIRNVTALTNVSIYWLNVSVNDTTNNLISGVFYIDIIAYRYFNPCAVGLSVLYDNPRIPHIKYWGC